MGEEKNETIILNLVMSLHKHLSHFESGGSFEEVSWEGPVPALDLESQEVTVAEALAKCIL